MGRYTISDKSLVQIVSHVGTLTKGVDKIQRTRITEMGKGITIDVDIHIQFGHQIMSVSETLQKAIKTNLEKMTHLNVQHVNVYVKMLIKK